MADGAVPLEPGVVSGWGFAVLDDSRTLLLTDDGWVAPATAPGTDLYFFGFGLDYRDAIKAFYAVSGPTPVLPRFALGNWWSRYHRYTADEYVALITGSPTRASRSRSACSTWTGTWSMSIRSTAAAGPATAGTASCSPTRRGSCSGCTTTVCG